MGIMSEKSATIDKLGRLVIPKIFRESLNLVPGDTFDVRMDDGTIVLTLGRTPSTIVKEEGMWVYYGKASVGDTSISELISQMRDERLDSISGLMLDDGVS